MTPAEAEMHFLENVKKLSMYGVDLHHAKVTTHSAKKLHDICRFTKNISNKKTFENLYFLTNVTNYALLRSKTLKLQQKVLM